MRPDYDSPVGPRCPQDTLKALVAFGGGGIGADVAIVYANKEMLWSMAESMLDAGEIFEHGCDGNPDQGIWVWEGQAERGVGCTGKWQRPSDAEWHAVERDINPFEEGE